MRYPNCYTVMSYKGWMTGAEFTCGIIFGFTNGAAVGSLLP